MVAEAQALYECYISGKACVDTDYLDQDELTERDQTTKDCFGDELVAFLDNTSKSPAARAAGCICYHRFSYLILGLLGYRDFSSDTGSNDWRPPPAYHEYTNATGWFREKLRNPWWRSFEDMRNTLEEIIVERHPWEGRMAIQKSAMDDLWSAAERKLRETVEILSSIALQDGGRCFLDVADVAIFSAVVRVDPHIE